MRNMLAAALLLAAATALGSQEDRSKRIVEGPLKTALGPSDKVDLGADGLVWHEGMDAVVDRGRPVVLMQLLGRLDDVFC